MVEVGTTAFVVLGLFFIFLFLYIYADRVDKEEELLREWDTYNKELELWWWQQQWQ